MEKFKLATSDVKLSLPFSATFFPMKIRKQMKNDNRKYNDSLLPVETMINDLNAPYYISYKIKSEVKKCAKKYFQF